MEFLKKHYKDLINEGIIRRKKWYTKNNVKYVKNT